MAKSSNTKTAKKRVKVGKLSTTKKKLTGKDMKKVKGGVDSFSLNFEEIRATPTKDFAQKLGNFGGILIDKPKV